MSGCRVDVVRRIRRAVLLVVSGTLVGCGGGGGGPVDGGRAREHTKQIVELGPRPSGSRNLTAAANYIQQELRKLGLAVHEQRWTESVELHGTARTIPFQNLWAEVPGPDPQAGPVVLLACHYDSKLCEGHPDPAHNFPFVGAIDAAGAAGTLLELARHLKGRDNKVDFWLVFFDGEESLAFDWNDQLALFGSRHFVKTMAEDKTRFPDGLRRRMAALVLLDLIGDEVQKIDKDKASSKELLDLFEAAAKRIGESDRMYRYVSEFKDDHIPFLDYGIPAIDLIDFVHRVPAMRGPNEPPEIRQYRAWWHTKEDTIDKVSADSLAIVGNLVWAALPDLEEFARKRIR
jgi:hypothetical protein